MKINYDEYIDPNDNYFGGNLPDIMENLDTDNKFCDPYFKHGKNIINIAKKEALIDQKILRWERISNIIDINDDNFNIIDINDDKSDEFLINQNSLGDCYFIAFLRSLKLFKPDKYYKIFGKYFAEIGYYEIYFFTEDGQQVIVFVDDYILINKDSKPYFASLKEEDLYTVGRNILVEKAYAKMKGSYGKIVGGYNASFPILGINSLDLVGNEFLSKENKEIYEMIEDEIGEKNIVLSGTKNKDPNIISGLYEGHMYSNLSVEKKSDIYILKLNNPYGENNYEKMKNFKLDLDKKYKDIEEDIINFNRNNTKNGTLKIDIENFKKHYDLVEICEFVKIKKKIKGIKITGGDHPTGLIDNAYEDRRSIMDILRIPKKDQKKFIDKCNNDLSKALYLLSKIFLKYGTSKESFYNHLLNEQDNNTNSSHFPNFFSYLNPFNYNWFSK